MPKKVQLKLLSASGELLNVITCHGGQVTVFRANSGADLRPYQRALSGATSKERISISVDGSEYNSEQHNLIGLGEPLPHTGLSLENYFETAGISAENTSALLNSFGIDRSLSTPCSTLTPDEERRIRLIVATCEPAKLLVLNEPFEHISSQWREQFAQLLTNFARQRNGLIIVTSLSFRPESWIDNDSVARVQVGETLQRTIGFGGAQSSSTGLMNQLRDAVREDLPEGPEESPTVPPSSEMLSRREAPTETRISSLHFTERLPLPIAQLLDRARSIQRDNPSVAPVAFAAIGVACALASILLITGRATTSKQRVELAMQQQAAEVSKREILPQQQSGHGQTQEAAAKEASKQPAPALSNIAEFPGSNLPAANSVVSDVAIPPARGILLGYPDAIRVSLIETARGGGTPRGGSVASPDDSNQAPKAAGTQKDSGNLFKLLESASSSAEGRPQDQADSYDDSNSQPTQSWQSSPSAQESEVDPSDEQQRREAIRQKFLEAIRAAAQKRQAADDDSGA